MHLTALKFQGFQNYIKARQWLPVGLENRPVEVITLQDVWIPAGSYKHVSIMKFPDGDKAYTKSLPEAWEYSARHERGAYLVAQELGLDIVPETQLALLPQDPEHSGEPVLTSVQDGVVGPDVRALTQTERAEVLKEEDSLIELFIYIAVSCDGDHEGQNVIRQQSTGKLKSIDNEFSGEYHYQQSVLPRLSFPEEFRSFLTSDTVIPARYLVKIKSFIKRRKAIEKRLSPLYKKEAIAKMFENAEYLLKNPGIKQIAAFLAIKAGTDDISHDAQTSQKPPVPKTEQPTRWPILSCLFKFFA